MPDKHVALVYQQFDLGGRQKALLVLADTLNKRGWKVDVLSFMPGILDQLFEKKGIPVHTISARLKTQRIIKLRQYFLQQRPSIVHTHLFSAGFWGRIAAKLADVPVIIHTEGGMPFEDKRWKRVPAERFLTRISDRVICVARSIKTHLVEAGGLPAESLVVIPNGIATDELLEIPIHAMGDPPVIFSAGRLASVKGYDILIRAVAHLDNFTGRLILAGDGSEMESLRQLASSLHVADRVQFLGYRDDIHQLLSQADLYVTPSRSEGLSNSVLEAMAAGVPVVATDVGGNRELLGDTGIIVPPEDPAAMAMAISKAVSDTDATRQRARDARKRLLENYTLDYVVAAHEELYYECLRNKGISVN